MNPTEKFLTEVELSVTSASSSIDEQIAQINRKGMRPKDQLTIKKLTTMLRVAEAAMNKSEKACLCSRHDRFGFDYGETHATLGKPGPGKRWLTPIDIIREAQNKLNQLAGEK